MMQFPSSLYTHRYFFSTSIPGFWVTLELEIIGLVVGFVVGLVVICVVGVLELTGAVVDSAVVMVLLAGRTVVAVLMVVVAFVCGAVVVAG